MAYIIRRTDQGGGYVAPAGSASSYVSSPAQARRFRTLAAAQAERCPGNEVVMQFFPGAIKPLTQAED